MQCRFFFANHQNLKIYKCVMCMYCMYVYYVLYNGKKSVKKIVPQGSRKKSDFFSGPATKALPPTLLVAGPPRKQLFFATFLTSDFDEHCEHGRSAGLSTWRGSHTPNMGMFSLNQNFESTVYPTKSTVRLRKKTQLCNLHKA